MYNNLFGYNFRSQWLFLTKVTENHYFVYVVVLVIIKETTRKIQKMTSSMHLTNCFFCVRSWMPEKKNNTIVVVEMIKPRVRDFLLIFRSVQHRCVYSTEMRNHI